MLSNYLFKMSAPFLRKNETSRPPMVDASVASARARSVLPVPGYCEIRIGI
jgi:hypothetical protein